MAKVELKAPVVDEIKGYVSEAKSVVLVDYRGLTVEQDTRLRKALREAGVVYKVYKNTMLHLAFDGTDYAQIKSAIVDGEYYDENAVKVLATIPSKDELISKLLGSLQSPITNFARVVKQIAEAQGEAAEA